MKRSKSVNLAVVPLLAAAFLAGCGGEKETAYCVDQSNRVVENRNCDRGSNGGFFWFFGAAGLSRGSFAGAGRAHQLDRQGRARQARRLRLERAARRHRPTHR